VAIIANAEMAAIVIGAAAATVAVLAIASVALLFCFAVTVSWLLSVLMPD